VNILSERSRAPPAPSSPAPASRTPPPACNPRETSLIAPARLHQLDPEAYLRDRFRVLPHWPSGRFLERCPRDWRAARARLVAAELERELGPLTIPPPLPSSEQPASR
jgi:hypothetical protein